MKTKLQLYGLTFDEVVQLKHMASALNVSISEVIRQLMANSSNSSNSSNSRELAPTMLKVIGLWGQNYKREMEIARLTEQLAAIDDLYKTVDHTNQFVVELSKLTSHEIHGFNWWLDKKEMTLTKLVKKAVELFEVQ